MLDDLVAGLRTALPGTVVALWLHGDAATAAADAVPDRLDLLAALVHEPGADELDAARGALVTFGERHAAWAGRVDLIATSTSLLRNWPRTDGVAIVAEAGNEPRLERTGRDRLPTWHLARAHAVTLWGPKVVSLVVPVSQAEYDAHVAAHRAR